MCQIFHILGFLLLFFNADMNHTRSWRHIYIISASRRWIFGIRMWLRITSFSSSFACVCVCVCYRCITYKRKSLTLLYIIFYHHHQYAQNIWYYSVWQQNIASHSSFYNWIARNNLCIHVYDAIHTNIRVFYYWNIKFMHPYFIYCL